MDMTPFGAQELRVSIDKLYRAAGGAGAGSFYPSDDDPMPHGPWDPVIRGALSRFRAQVAAIAVRQQAGAFPNAAPLPWPMARAPEPWMFLDAVALNPQPLPPKDVWLRMMADEVIARAEMMAELAAGFSDGSEERGIIIVGGYVGRFVGWCGNEPIVIRPPKGGPVPDPDPEPWWRSERLSGRDLLILGSRFAGAALGAQSQATASAFGQAAGDLGLEAVARL